MRKTQGQIVESIISTMYGGKYSDELNVSFEIIRDAVDDIRGTVARLRYEKDRSIHPDWIQKFYPDFDQVIQEEKCFIRFKCPGFVYLSKSKDGLLYCGSQDYADNFRRITREEWSDIKRHKLMDSGRRNMVFYESGELYVVSKTDPRKIMVNGIFNSPSEIPTYNFEKDLYPVDAEAVGLIEELVRNKIVGISIKTASDEVSNSNDDTKWKQSR